MISLKSSPVFGAAVLKLSFVLNGQQDSPGYNFVYNGTLQELNLTDKQVDDFIAEHREVLEEHIKKAGHSN